MINLFQNISDKNKEKIIKSLEANTFVFKKNTKILSTIKNENIICFIENGDIEIIRNDYNGNKIIMDELTDNDLFGSMISFISSDEYEIITKSDCKIIVMDYNIIINNEDNSNYYRKFVNNLLLILSDKINERNQRIEILTKKSIRNKLLEYFKMMSNKNKSKIIYLPFSFTELSEYLAIDRTAMSRELKNLKDEGFIETKNRKITLLY